MKYHYQIKNVFCNELYLEGITDKDYTHAQKVFEEFNLRNIGDHHDLYVQNDALSLADVFENFRDKRDLSYLFFISIGIIMGSLLKKDWSRIRINN